MRPVAPPDTPIERIRHNLVSLRMPRALEALDGVVQQLERGQISSIEAIDTLLTEELSVREGRRIKAALQMARLATIKTLSGFDFSFQPSLDRNRIMALAGLDFIDRREVVHFIGQSGTGKTHLASALGVEAIRAGRTVYFSSLADIIESLAKADREGRLRERIRFCAGRSS
jgi:DNA replication protein DnaC